MAADDGMAHARNRSGDDDVLRRLRTGTAEEHEDVERTLDLLDPDLARNRLAAVLDRMHGFWLASEAGLDAWAGTHPADAAALDWPRRRRAAMFAEDLRALDAAPSSGGPTLPPLAGTDEALGRLYVLEGSTLGGTFIDRHLASLPHLADVRVRAFSPYGGETGAMWAAFRRVTRERVAAGGSPDTMVDSARATFRALAAWCRPVAAVPA
ncbi:biliverdin-producing heme oxygenase [Blastococcus sp. SYSU D00922]